MSTLLVAKARDNLPDKSIVATLCKILLCIGILCYILSLISSNHSNSLTDYTFLVRKGKILQSKISMLTTNSPSATTNISHLLFGIIGSQGAWNYRKGYVESWWRPNATKGYLYLDSPPAVDLLPWSSSSPPFRVSENLGVLIAETNPYDPGVIRMVHAILEIFREKHQEGWFRWLVMGDDDTIFLVDNMVDLLAKYDHTQFYYIGNPSEYLLSNHWFSFNMAFGGGGFVLSYPLVKALAENMESCLRRYPHLKTADIITMACIADIGVDLSPHKGFNQIDFHGDLSGFLSTRSKSPLISLHHFDMVDPIFPAMDRVDATRHLMEAAKLDQSRMLQQTICYQRQEKQWTVSVSWGYSVYIYENIFPRSWLKDPIETFQTWMDGDQNDPPHYMFNTRLTSGDPCENPHVFFFKSVRRKSRNSVHSIYHRVFPRGMPACGLPGNRSADNISEIHVYSPARKRNNIDRCECCDIGYKKELTKVKVTFRECKLNETIA